MAEVGERIVWTYDSNDPHVEVFRVGHGHYIERLVDGLTEVEWMAREINDRYSREESEINERIERGELTEADREELLAELMANLNSEARHLFGNPVEELDDYARRYK